MNQILDEQKWWCSLVKGRNKHCVSSNTSAKHQKSRKGAEKKKQQQRNQQSQKSTSAERSIRHTHRQHIRKATRTVTEKLQKSKQQSQLRQHSSRRGTEKQQKSSRHAADIINTQINQNDGWSDDRKDTFHFLSGSQQQALLVAWSNGMILASDARGPGFNLISSANTHVWKELLISAAFSTLRKTFRKQKQVRTAAAWSSFIGL